MKGRKGTLWLAVAAAMLVPARARARGTPGASAAGGDGPPQRQGRRRSARPPQALSPVVSPCGRHVVEVVGGAVLIDGRRVRPPSADSVFLVAPPTWRRDGSALAWIERSRGESRLVVVPDLDAGHETLPWTLPAVSTDDRVFWAGPQRVVVGPAVLAPRAIATWTE
jgi:hypothetical protein